MTTGEHPEIVWIDAHSQRLGVVPRIGGGVARWQWLGRSQPVELWRPWSGASADPVTLASFPMLPWVNRISGGGFEFDGRFYPVAPNRFGEPYPIHGDGWLQAWTWRRPAAHSVEMRLRSHRFAGDPYEYDAVQRFELHAGGMLQSLAVTHRGTRALPYGIGMHPWFERTPDATLTAKVSGVWLAGDDPIPARHAPRLPAGWRLGDGIGMDGALIDNSFSGWDGVATVRWPERAIALRLEQQPLRTPGGPVAPQYCQVYRPVGAATFCFEPMSQPIDAANLPQRPGLVALGAGETLELQVDWRICTLGVAS